MYSNQLSSSPPPRLMLPKFLTRKPDYNSLTPEWLTARGYTRLFERTSRTSRRRKATTALVVALICSLLPVYWISSSLVRGVSLSTVEIPSFADCQHDGPLAAHHTSPHTPGVLPPLYPAYHRAELALPQHDESDPFAGGKKYLWVANHVQCELHRPTPHPRTHRLPFIQLPDGATSCRT